MNIFFQKLKNFIKIFYNKNAVFSKYFENLEDIKKKKINVKPHVNFNLKFVKHNKLKLEKRFLVSIKELRKEKKQNINILEIGSGYSFISLIARKLNLNKRIKTYVIETKVTTDSLKKSIPNYWKNNFIFYNDLKNIPNIKYDFVIFNSSIQYIENLENFLTQLLKKNIATIIITETLITKKIKDFYCLQSSHNHRILYHVISLIKLKKFFSKNNLQLTFSKFYNYEKNLFSDGLYSKVELVNLVFKKYK